MSLGSDSSDPTDFEGIDIIPGILPVSPDQNPRKEPRTNAATAASAAGVRAFTAQAVAFYFRAPAKAFFRTRVDYLAYARNLQHLNSTVSSSPTSRRLAWLRSTTPGVLASAIKYYGWRVIPEQILPPLLANVGVGAVLYTSYLQILGALHEESAKATKRVYPPPLPSETFTAGLLAGSIQSFIAAPLDAIQVRYERNDVTTGVIKSNGKGITQPQSMWTFGHEKLREIGVRGVFAGWGLSFLKDSFGSAVFFSTFEWVKAQGYYNFLKWYYGSLNMDAVESLARKRPSQERADKQFTIRPHYAIEPAFLFLGGFSASVAQQSVIYPLYHIQVQHWDHLEDLDEKARELRKMRHLPEASTKSRWLMLRVYYRAYQETWAQCRAEASKDARGNIRRWLYRGFWWNTIRQVPSTSAGLIIFELVRRKYGLGSDEVRINRDGYDILLN